MQKYPVKDAAEALNKIAALCIPLKMDPIGKGHLNALGKESYAYYDPKNSLVISDDFSQPLTDADKAKLDALISFTVGYE